MKTAEGLSFSTQLLLLAIKERNGREKNSVASQIGSLELASYLDTASNLVLNRPKLKFYSFCSEKGRVNTDSNKRENKRELDGRLQHLGGVKAAS